MKKFILLFRGEYREDTTSQEDWAKMMQAWQEWYAKLKKENILVDPGHPLARGGRIVTQEDIRAGEVKSGSEFIGMLMIIQAETIDRAAEIAQGSPSIADSTIEVREAMPLPG